MQYVQTESNMKNNSEPSLKQVVHPFFAAKSVYSPGPSGKSALNELVQKTVLNITHLATAHESIAGIRRCGGVESHPQDETDERVALNLRKSEPTQDSESEVPNVQVAESAETNNQTTGLPMTPVQALKVFHSYLTPIEQTEILTFKFIYFLGLQAEKVRSDVTLPNCGYDDDRNDYKIVIGDHLQYRYEVLNCIGKGAFGQVVKCFDHKSKEFVAVKIVRNERRFHRQVLIEVQVLQLLKDRNCSKVISLRDHFKFREHMFLSFDLLDQSVFAYLAETGYRGLSLTLIRKITGNIVEALEKLKRLQLIHCDLKPENVLFTAPDKEEVRLIDFGSACFEKGQIFTYVQSRFYRAPEVLLGAKYSYPIDIWSLGCLVAELYSGRPLFPGGNEKDQLLWITSVLGSPPAELLSKSTKASRFFDSTGCPKDLQTCKGVELYPHSITLTELICRGQHRTPIPTLLDFVTGKFHSACLQWDPEARMTPEQAKTHPFLRDIEDLPISTPCFPDLQLPIPQEKCRDVDDLKKGEDGSLV